VTAVNRIALAGNPNSGAPVFFNALLGVTAEKLESAVHRGARRYRFTDLTGIYDLTVYSVDEVAARDFILNDGIPIRTKEVYYAIVIFKKG
jgi:ferrous iron transport protein B